MNKFKILFLAFLLTSVVSTNFATTRKVLFIGNSYTATNAMTTILQNLTIAMGDTLIFDESDPGGYTFSSHCTYAPTITKIFSRPWDIVVLQEQSQLPSFPPTEVDTEVYPYAHILDSMIHANDSCTQTMFMMTWGHANGDPFNCASYPVICTYQGMQMRLRQSYLQMTQNNAAIVAPVGAAWNVMMDSFASSIWLYIPDSSHPNMSGSYLESCVLYSSIFHKPTFGCTDTAGLSPLVAQTIQRISDKVVLDSLDKWQQYGHYPYAGFNATCIGDSAVFTDNAVITSQHFNWSFGDSSSVLDTNGNTFHIYTTASTYTVSLTASNNCFSETLSKSIYCGGVDVRNGLMPSNNKVIVSQHGNGNITFNQQNSTESTFDIIEVYDSKGAVIRKYKWQNQSIIDNFVPGFYFIKAYCYKTGNTYIEKLIII